MLLHMPIRTTGSAVNYFAELYINPADAASQSVAHYIGKIKELKDGEIIDLGGRNLEVVFTPGHTPGSTTFIDKKAGYGFSGTLRFRKSAFIRHFFYIWQLAKRQVLLWRSMDKTSLSGSLFWQEPGNETESR